ncbi:hypothetical protein I302_105241 [Kwoniella bestiolae CBS 10118]|uniref:Uncharacterized protein n=1 Tax=Kwoniella bestiolae CBS 10118 TaxID=1296100 RepID=A0A1B9FSK7_9TREE|nr:hypothetical protein I302_08529 [Kwoniella bestiolae CBS 10118]OCF21751.1 hypothetical protein I302_08529 [Kwoniella bestiolae CBS 10118]
MSHPTTFIISPSPSVSPLPRSPSLSLLPFSLGPNSTPYSTTTAPTSSYFKPRPTPDGKSTHASFRGRTVVGQYVDIPKGWRGVILSTGKRPDRGGLLDISSGSGSTSKEEGSTTKGENGDVDMEEGTSLRRTTRQLPSRRRGTGQVALSKPRTSNRSQVNQSKKRFRLDSDDEDQEGEQEEEEHLGARITRTPSKRAKTAYTTPQKRSGDIPIPDIIVQEATPLKYPLPTPKKRLNQRRSSPSPVPMPKVTESMELVEEQIKVDDEVAKSEGEDESQTSHIINQDTSTSTFADDSDSDDKIQVKEEEDLIPSPSTEDDPPAFDVNPDSEPNIKIETETNTQLHQEDEIPTDTTYGPLRILRPTSTFEGFMLYTPDDPLIGFRADELNEGEDQKQNGGGMTFKEEQNEEEQKPVDPSGDSDSTIQVRKSWWRAGGAGEGGDEFVRGLGEWLGLVEVLNEPVYLEGLEEGEDEETMSKE